MKTFSSRSLSSCAVALALVITTGCDNGKKAAAKTPPKQEPIPAPFNPAPQQPPQTQPAPQPIDTKAPLAPQSLARGKVTIANKEALAKVTAGTDVTVQFSLEGLNASDVLVLCRSGKAAEFNSQTARPCSGALSHKLSGLEAGASYTLAIEVMDQKTNQKLAEDTVSMQVEAAKKPELTLGGAEELSATTSGMVTITAAVEGMSGLKYVCTVNSKVVPCEGGRLSLDLAQYSGQGQVQVQAMDQGGVVIASRETTFCAGSCNAQPVDTFVANEFGLDANYIIHLPPNMHMLTYATNRSFDAMMVNSLSILNDPLFIPVPCGGVSAATPDAFNPGRIVSLANGEGRIFQYCQRNYPIPAQYKFETGDYKTFNSIEFSSDAPNPNAPSIAPAGAYERFTFNHFGTTVESMLPVSRFYSLCQRNYGAGAPVVRIVNNFYGEGLFTQVNYCKTIIQNQFGAPLEVWVAGMFFNKIDGLAPSALEMTYIATAGTLNTAFRDEVFIRQAILRVRTIVESTGLNEQFLGVLGPNPSGCNGCGY